MSELMSLSLSSLEPNPFRDLTMFPLREDRVAKLQESIRAQGFWEGVIARVGGAGFQLAFGHHRIEAARRELGPDAEVSIIVRDLDDPTMLHMMERENIEDGLGFYYTVVQPVRAAVLAFAAGQVTFPEPGPQYRRSAPSFQVDVTNVGNISKPYTAQTLAAFLKWTKGTKDQADERVTAALGILEMIELGRMTPAQADQPKAAWAAELQRLAGVVAREREAAVEAEQSVLMETVRRAETAKDHKGKPAPDTVKAEEFRKKVERLEREKPEIVATAVKSTVAAAAKMFKSGESVRSVRNTLAPVIGEKVSKKLREAVRKNKVEGYTASEVESYARRLDGILLEAERIRLAASRGAAAKDLLSASLTRLAARVSAMQKELAS